MQLAIKFIVDEAKKRNINVRFYDKDFFLLEYHGHEEYFCETLSSKTTALASKFCINKDLTKLLLKEAHLSVPMGNNFSISQRAEAFVYSKEIDKPIVMKPTKGMEGDLVFLNITGKDDFNYAWRKIAGEYSEIMVEKMFDGLEYRIFATPEKALSVVHRVPANVVGDGKHNIEELIEIKNKDPKRGSGLTSLAEIKLDDVTSATLLKNNLTVKSIPKLDSIVFLRENSNISTGGESVECTELAHPSVLEIAVKSIKAIPGLAYGGVDFMTTDISKPQDKNSYVVIEINSIPGLALHHQPTSGSQKNIAKEIIDINFPETEDKND